MTKRNPMVIRLAVLAGIAVVAVLAAVVLAGGPGSDGGTKTTSDTSALKGIPQSGLALGSPKAPVTIVEFADLQCPFCAEYHRNVFPSILDRYVRTGKVRLELRLLASSVPTPTGSPAWPRPRRHRTACGSSWAWPTTTRARRTPATRRTASSTSSRATPG